MIRLLMLEFDTIPVTQFGPLQAPNLAYHRRKPISCGNLGSRLALRPGPRKYRLVCRNKEAAMSKQSDLDNHADQLNPNNDAYWQSRGDDERPDEWDEKASEDDRAKQEGTKGHNETR